MIEESASAASPGLCVPLTKRLPEGKLKEAISSTSLCFWVCALLVLVVTTVSAAALGVVGLLIGGIVPILFLSMRYLWWRLVWEPFGSLSWQEGQEQEQEQGGGERQMYMTFVAGTAQVCCPAKCNYRRVCHTHTPLYLIFTGVFWLIFVLSLVGLLLSGSVAHQSAEPPLFIVICYNTGGSIVLLIVSVWIVDTVVLLLTWTCAAGNSLLRRHNNSSNGEKGVQQAFQPVNTKVSPAEEGKGGTSSNGENVVAQVTAAAEEGRGRSNQHQEQEQALVCHGGMRMEGREEKDGEEEEVILGGGEVEQQTIKQQDTAAPTPKPLCTKILLRRVMAACSLGIFLIMLSFSTADSYGDPRSIHLSIPVRQLPACMDGFKLALLTDVHAGSLVGDKDVRRIVELVQDWHPDAVAVSGDLGDQVVNDALKEKIAPLADLASVPDGVFWTPGNHENSAGIQGYRDLFSSPGGSNSSSSPFKFIVTLENAYQSVSFSRANSSTSGSCSFDMAGLADESGEEVGSAKGQVAPDLNQTLWGRDPSSALVLLNHQPVHFKRSVQAGAGLVLAGHTHGGQLWPNHALLWFVFGTHISGLFTDSSPITDAPPTATASVALDPPAYMYVSEGTVGWGPRVRLLSYPEITYITLRNPELFVAEGGSTSSDEEFRAAVIGLIVGLVVLPISLLVCTLQACGCCWRREADAEAAKGWMKACGGGREGHMHEV